jgi:hypothetical protein
MRQLSLWLTSTPGSTLTSTQARFTSWGTWFTSWPESWPAPSDVETPPAATWPWVILILVPVAGFGLILWLLLPRRRATDSSDDA